MKLLSDRLAYIYAEHPELEGERGQTGFRKKSGATKSVVNQWMSNSIKTMGLRYAMELEKQLGYSHLWLMTGEGEPRLAANAEAPLPDAMRLKCENLAEYRLLSMYRLANTAERLILEGAASSVENRLTRAVHNKTEATGGV